MKLKLNQFFYMHSVFTYQEFLEYLEAQGTTNSATQHSILKYHLKQGHIMRLRRELYAVVPPTVDPDTCTVDPYLIASKMAEDAVLGYHTALELHGLAYSSFEHFTYITRHHIRPFVFRNQLFRSVQIPVSLTKKQRESYGVMKVKREGIDMRVTSLARTLVDILARPDLAGGWEEIWRSLETLAVFNVEEAIEYVRLLENATTAAKLGYFLEQLPSAVAVDKKYIQQLQRQRPNQCHYLERNRRHPSKFIPKWNLMVPLEIIGKTWEEPHEDI